MIQGEKITSDYLYRTPYMVEQVSGAFNSRGGQDGPWAVLRIRIRRIRLSEVRLRILLSSCKNSKKNLDSYCFVNMTFIFENWCKCNVPLQSNKQKNLEKNCFLLAFWRSRIRRRSQIHSSEAWIRESGRIRTIMSRTRNTGHESSRQENSLDSSFIWTSYLLVIAGGLLHPVHQVLNGNHRPHHCLHRFYSLKFINNSCQDIW
jgi:hypothetical protein